MRLQNAMVGALFAAALMLSPAATAGQAAVEIPKGDGEQFVRPQAAVEAIDQIFSPYCAGMLETCSSSMGAALRDSIVDYALEGWTTEELVEWVIENHGEEYRALPKAEGRALIAWIVPPLGLALGAGAVFLALRGMIRPRDEEGLAAAEGSLTEEDEEFLREAMNSLDEEEEATFF